MSGSMRELPTPCSSSPIATGGSKILKTWRCRNRRPRHGRCGVRADAQNRRAGGRRGLPRNPAQHAAPPRCGRIPRPPRQRVRTAKPSARHLWRRNASSRPSVVVEVPLLRSAWYKCRRPWPGNLVQIHVRNVSRSCWPPSSWVAREAVNNAEVAALRAVPMPVLRISPGSEKARHLQIVGDFY